MKSVARHVPTKLTGFTHTLNLVASQLEAASSLLRYAADDLRDLLERADIGLADEVRLVIQALHAQSATLDGNAAFCVRLGEEDDEDDDAGNETGQAQWRDDRIA